MDHTGEVPDFDLERELEWMSRQEEVSDGFDTIYNDYWQTHDRQWKPAISGVSFANRPPMSVTAYVEGFVYPGCIAALIGPPKAGKSTFVWSMLDKLIGGEMFLGQATQLPGSVLYVSEQSAFSFDTQLLHMPGGLRDRILKSGKFFLMLPEHHLVKRINNLETSATSWQERLELWKEAIKRTRADVLVIDTFGQYADFGGAQGENDNAIICKRLFELRELQKVRPSLAILLLSHSNKASAKKKFLSLLDCRGGSAFVGGLDHGVTFNKSGDGKGRFIQIESRMVPEEQKVVVWLPTGEYANVKEMSIRDIQEELQVSYRQARKISQSIKGDDSEDEFVDHPIPIVTVKP